MAKTSRDVGITAIHPDCAKIAPEGWAQMADFIERREGMATC